jgi:hypothetical protein
VQFARRERTTTRALVARLAGVALAATAIAGLVAPRVAGAAQPVVHACVGNDLKRGGPQSAAQRCRQRSERVRPRPRRAPRPRRQHPGAPSRPRPPTPLSRTRATGDVARPLIPTTSAVSQAESLIDSRWCNSSARRTAITAASEGWPVIAPMGPVKVLYPLGFSTDVRVRTLDNAG